MGKPMEAIKSHRVEKQRRGRADEERKTWVRTQTKREKFKKDRRRGRGQHTP